MMNRLEDLWKSANDGAVSPIGPLQIRADTEVEDLLDAWYAERRTTIECEILLDQSRGIIERLLAEFDPSASASKRARRLLRAIERTLKTADSGET